MANYYGASRTNYVRLKDELAYEQFKQVVSLLGGDTVQHEENGVRTIAAFGNEDDGGFASYVDVEELVESGYQSRNPDSVLDAKKGEYLTDQDGMRELEEVDFDDDILFELYPLLAEGEVLVMQSIGQEKMRYLCGYAEAIDCRGHRIEVSMDEIYQKAKEQLHSTAAITRASY